MILAFGECVLDLDRRELRRGANSIATAPQVFDLLVYLIENRERVVSRDDVLDAVWRGRIISDSTLTSHINAVRKAIGDSGSEQALVRTIARKGFRFVGNINNPRVLPVATHEGSKAEHLEANSLAPPTLPSGPSIAVLPFVNLSGDPQQDYFADGLVEDIIGALSRFSWLFVIARNSSFAYKNRAVDVKQVGLELGVRYVLEGNVRKAAGRVRISGQLIDATTRGHLWADRFEGSLDNIFELQDQLTESLVGAISPQLEMAEMVRAKQKPTASLDSYDYYLRGMAAFHQGTKESITLALSLFYSAIKLDSQYAAAYGMAAWCFFWRRTCGWAIDIEAETSEGARLARLAVNLGQTDAVALTRGAHALAHFEGDIVGSIELLERARLLNPNLAAAWFLGGFLRLWHGEPEEAIIGFKHAIRLSPLDSEIYRMQVGVAMANLLAGRFEEACSWARKAASAFPDLLFVNAVSAASHALAGHAIESNQAVDRMRELHPDLSVSQMINLIPLCKADHLSVFSDGLRKAGLPD